MGTTGVGALGLAVLGMVLGAFGSGISSARAGELSTEVLWGGAETGGRAACLRAGGRILEMPVARVNPFGLGRDDAPTEPVPPSDEGRSALCVFGAMGADAATAAPAWSVAATDGLATGSIEAEPFGGRCAEECDASLTLLSDRDREALIALPERVRQTLLAAGAAAADDDDGGTRNAREVAAMLAGAGTGTETFATPLDLSQGDMDCTWRRFEGRRTRIEPTGRCRVGRNRDGLPTLEAIAGAGLTARLEPLTDRYAMYLGGSSDAGEAPRPYDPSVDGSNRTGLAAKVGNQVHLVEAFGTTGFAVLTLSGN